ncbi:MAG: hypothetical protein M1829_002001 [Trizodia sp. TS-e1964]|nr:MAG: hypothetical protein M1829_002001 [Trizodia sp. TS-e1964]
MSAPQQPTGGAPPAAAAGNMDYGDKGGFSYLHFPSPPTTPLTLLCVELALEAAEKKMGMKQSRETNEKITDFLRTCYEKVTGKKVSAKISN